MSMTNDNPQFMRLESYPRVPSNRAGRNGKRSAAGVVAEVLREELLSCHVETPRAPSILWGNPAEALQKAIAMGAEAKDSRGRRRRSDAHILGGCVCSYPIPVHVVEQDVDQLATLQKWITKVCEWAFQEFGKSNVGAIVQHMDETMPHLHILITPPSPGEEPSPLRRAGNAAAQARKDRSKRVRVIAHNDAGRQLQASYYELVSVPFGHLRHGVHRRPRMTRAERNKEIAQAREMMALRTKIQEEQLALAQQSAALRARKQSLEDFESEHAKREAALQLRAHAVAELHKTSELREIALATREASASALAGELALDKAGLVEVRGRLELRASELSQRESAMNRQRVNLTAQQLAQNASAVRLHEREQWLQSKERELRELTARARQMYRKAAAIVREGVTWIEKYISPSELRKARVAQTAFEYQARADISLLNNLGGFDRDRTP